MINFGYSGMPPDYVTDEAFLDGLVTDGFQAFELAFVKDFPWKKGRCRSFGEAAAERGIALTVHAPYFAMLTLDDEDRAKRVIAALEHSMKLCAALGGTTVVAHPGNQRDRDPAEVMAVVRGALDYLEPKIRELGVTLSLETAGKRAQFGRLGDLTALSNEYSWVRTVIDWAHVHAMSNGGLKDKESFSAVLGFARESLPSWQLDQLHCHFSDVLYGDSGEIKHIPYGEGSLRVGPLVEAAVEAGQDLTLISEMRERSSHLAVLSEIKATLHAMGNNDGREGRALGTLAEPPGEVRVVQEQGSYRPLGITRPLRLSNIDKPFFDGGETKGDLIQYYSSIAPLLLPHLAGRPIVMARYPDGWEGEWFYEKQAPGHQPDWLELAPVHSSHRGEPIEFITAQHPESLMWLANMGCIEIHPWLSRLGSIETPDFAIFDLDPSEGCTWQQVVDVAKLVKLVLDQFGLVSYPKLSGATGIHIYVPLDPVYSYRRVRAFVEAIGRLLVQANPKELTMEWDISKRGHKIFIDHNQNVGGKTIASVYSVRPYPGAPVSTPILWDEIDVAVPKDFTIRTIWGRLAKYGDLFSPVLRGGQTIDAAEVALGLSPDDIEEKTK